MYTGNTVFMNSPYSVLSVYPCVYREHQKHFSKINFCVGLSLCIQGTLLYKPWVINASRFIPVYTGNTIKSALALAKTAGLSLCIQGTRLPTVHFSHFCRFIPVYTGNTLYYFINHKRGTVYPCVYREHMTSSLLKLSKSGLSLCIQGTQGLVFHIFHLLTVYPCVYREHGIWNCISNDFHGLSLCIQGTLRVERVERVESRFIPVYTGNTIASV